MEVRLLGLGLFQKKIGYKAPFLNAQQIQYIFGGNALFRFSSNLEYKNQIYKEGYFNINSARTFFVTHGRENLELHETVIEIQPSFFVFSNSFSLDSM